MFGPLMKCRIESYEFIVVNRFGEVLFRSTDNTQKWDGTYKGVPCDVGGYFYLLFHQKKKYFVSPINPSKSRMPPGSILNNLLC